MPPLRPPPLQGLSTAEAAERLRRHGPNDTGEGRRRGWLDAVWSVGREPMFLLLLAAAAIYLAVGDLGEGLLLGAFALVSVGLTVLQEHRGEQALDALRALAVPQASVVRDGRTLRIPTLEVVPGDLVVLAEGERIPADGVLREASAVQVDESLLTGESVPVRKVVAAAADAGTDAPGGEDTPQVYAGTLCVAGHGLAEVTATGRRTQMGRIGASLAAIDPGGTPLQRQLGRLVRQFGWVAIALSALLVLGYGLLRGQWLQGVLSALAFAMAMLPEEIPMVMTVFVGLAAWRMARMQVLARRPAVVEALGAATVLCVDKTGTLTENRQQLRRLVTAGADVDLTRGGELPEAVHALLEYGVMASRRGSADPMDAAVVAGGDRELDGTEHLHPAWLLAQEYPLTPDLLAMSQAWTRPDGVREVAAKGAAEAVADLCHLEPSAQHALLRQVDALAAQGLRVLAVARGLAPAGALPADQHDHDFELLGLLGFEDPLRRDVPAAVAQAHAAGIAVVMITGDHAATALAIAAQAGIATAAGALTGAQVEAMDDAALRQAVQAVRVFARMQPQQKLRLVQALQANGHTVAMTGDGVNDAPALKAAHIGIAMGVRGTDVAREAAGLVLLDEDFSRIVAGVRAGRRTFDNLRRAMTYILAVHVPVAGLALLPVLFSLPPLLLPAHVVLTEMIIDPACSFAFEGIAEAPGVMQRPPRPARDALLGRSTVWRGLAEGAVLLALVLGVYLLTLEQGLETARTLSVLALVTGNLVLVSTNVGTGGHLGWNRPLLLVAALTAAALALGILWAPAQGLLGFAPVAWPEALGCMAAAAAAVLLTARLTARLRD